MTKSELVTAIADKADLNRNLVEIVVDAYHDTVLDVLKRREPVSIVNFGSFQNVRRKAGAAVNPRTGERVEVAEARRVKFKASKNVTQSLPVR